MATNNSRDVKMTLSVETLGEENIQKLQSTISTLAKEGGDAAPEFQKLADEIGRIGEQAAALQTFSRLAEETQVLAQHQDKASATAAELRTRLDALSQTTQQAADRQRAVSAAVDDAKISLSAITAELVRTKAATDNAGLSEAEYAARVRQLKVAQAEKRQEIVQLSVELKKASAETKVAEAAESKLASSYKRAATEADRAARALQANATHVQEAAEAARDLGVTTDSIAASQTELVQALNRTGREAENLQQEVQRLADRERELVAVRAFEEQAKAASLLQQSAEYARVFDDALRRLAESERQLKQQANAEQWQREAESLTEAASAAQQLSREAAALEQAQRKLAGQRAFQKQAEDARQLIQAADYVRGWREELDRAEEQARRTAEEAKASAQRISSAFGTLGVRSVQELQTEIAQVRAAMETVRTAAGLTGGALNTAFASGEARIKQLEREIRQVSGTLTAADRAANLFKNSMGQIAAGNLIADGIGYLINKVKELGRAFIETIVQTEQVRRGLQAVHKNTAIAASQFQFLKNTANAAGVSVSEIAPAFVKFSAATKASGISLEITNRLFAEVTRAAGTLGLSGDQVTGMLEALGQMASKGTVSMEELRQQLGDRLPGALSLVAKGLGLSESALIKLVESGGLAARDLFPALTKALGEMRGETDSLIPLWSRFKNLLTETSQNAGDSGWTQLLTFGVKALTVAVGALVLPLSALFELLFGTARAAGILAGALVTLTNPLDELKRVAGEASDRQQRLTESFKNALSGTSAATTAAEQYNQRMEETGAAAAVASGAIASTAKAQDAQAFAAKLAADNTLDLGSKLVQLKGHIDAQLASQKEQIESYAKIAKAAKIEGDALIQLTELRGKDFLTIESQVQASEKYGAALQKLAEAQQTETELMILKRDEIIKTAIAQDGNTKSRQQEIDAINDKITVSKAETEQTRQSAAAAEQETRVRKLAVETYKDNAAAIGEYRKAMELAEDTLNAVIELQKEGWATDQDVAEARRRAAEATHLYNDAVNDSIKAIELESRVKQANANITLTKLEIEQRNYESLAQAARASGDYVLAIHYEIEARRKQIEIIKINSEMKRLEAEATIKALEVERAALDQLHPLLKQKQAEIDIRIANAKAKLLEADAGKDVIASLEREITALLKSRDEREKGRSSIDRDTSSRKGNTDAINTQTDALERQQQVQAGGFKDVSDFTKRGTQNDVFTDQDGTQYYKNAAGQLGSNGVMPGFTISAEQNRLYDFLNSGGKLTKQDEPFIRANFEAAKANFETAQRNSTMFSAGGLDSVYKKYNEARRAMEAISGSSVAGRSPAGALGGSGGGGGLARYPQQEETPGTTPKATQTVNINIGGRSTPVTVASEADAKNLTSVLRQLESAAGASS